MNKAVIQHHTLYIDQLLLLPIYVDSYNIYLYFASMPTINWYLNFLFNIQAKITNQIKLKAVKKERTRVGQKVNHIMYVFS